ncbi:TetR/AcrR family transcriptional regulator [Microbacterium sp. W1N]|uniref:TetR/AcrR family transcriptional regulator n=1 Tax=Microbacterium festucae TaxID=2977531 RepID=UPI0021C25274|nr:TetR/AcrR family transcriptional regulator [Microbacterium festucae]MCT9819587.1 TetR/AcrR family transcriptional regulator [Microbacterium festucae]
METQARILAAVWRVILARGIAGVSFRAVADAAGVSLGLVQHYHRTKDELIRASAQAMIAGSAARYEAETKGTDAAAFDLVLHAIPVAGLQRDGVIIWHAYLAASVTDPQLAELLRGAKRGQEGELARALEGRLGGDAAAAAARQLIAAADGLADRVITGDLTGAEATEAATALMLALTGIRPPEPPAPTTLDERISA